MRIATKIILAATLPATLIATVGLTAVLVCEASLYRSAIETTQARADYISAAIERLLERRIEQWQAYAASNEMMEALRESNQRFGELPDRARRIAEMDQVWQAAAATGEQSEFVRRVLENPLSLQLSKSLTSQTAQGRAPRYGEVFVTNRFGVNAAASNTTTDFLQSDETWWKSAAEKGVHLTPVEFDESSRVYSAALCLRLGPKDNFRGVLKVVWNLEEALELVETLASSTDGRRTRLTDATGKLLYASDLDARPLTRSNATVEIDASREAATDVDRVRGHSSLREPWNDFLGWQVVVDQPSVLALSSAGRTVPALRSTMVFATLFACILGACAAVRLSRRVRKLEQAITRFGDGELSARARIEGTDEIAAIAGHFDDTADRVSTLTADLRDKTAQLESKTQSLLVESETRRQEEREHARTREHLERVQGMEAVGQIAAGLAHEIRTPVQFVGDNVRFLADGYTDLIALYSRIRPLIDGKAAEIIDPLDRLEVIEMETEDLAYVLAETPNAIEEAIGGIDRINDIVTAMKSLGISNEKKLSTTDLHEALRCTITLARGETKYVADVVTEFAEIPAVECYPGPLSQVFLNMIINAGHAIEERRGTSPGRGTITVATQRHGETVVVRIGDDGCGMPPEVRDRVFEAFFTTKEVGKGTGFGLSLAHEVVIQEHGGRIEVDSTIGVGTTFSVFIPIVAKTLDESPEHVNSAPIGEALA